MPLDIFKNHNNRARRKAFEAQRRGWRRSLGHLNRYEGEVNTAKGQAFNTFGDERQRANEAYHQNLASIGADRDLAQSGHDQNMAISRQNLADIQASAADTQAGFQGYRDAGQDANRLLADIYSGGSAADSAFDTFRQNTGYRQQLNEGLAAVNSYAAGRGLRGSGVQQKALSEYARKQADTSFNNFASGLERQAGRGLDAERSAADARRAYTSMSVSERRNMQNQVSTLIQQLQNANANERTALAQKLDRLANTDAAFRGALTEYLRFSGVITGERRNAELALADIDAAEHRSRMKSASWLGSLAGAGIGAIAGGVPGAAAGSKIGGELIA